MAEETPQLDLAQAIRLADKLEKTGTPSTKPISHEMRNRIIVLLGKAWKTPDQLTDTERRIAAEVAKSVILNYKLRMELQAVETELDAILALAPFPPPKKTEIQPSSTEQQPHKDTPPKPNPDPDNPL
jgi:F0F1-type ATP synthase beta subunit